MNVHTSCIAMNVHTSCLAMNVHTTCIAMNVHTTCVAMNVHTTCNSNYVISFRQTCHKSYITLCDRHKFTNNHLIIGRVALL